MSSSLSLSKTAVSHEMLIPEDKDSNTERQSFFLAHCILPSPYDAENEMEERRQKIAAWLYQDGQCRRQRNLF